MPRRHYPQRYRSVICRRFSRGSRSRTIERTRRDALQLCPWDCQDTPNGFVDIADLFQLFGHWFAPGPCDFDGNGLGDINDLFEMFGNWGQCP